MRIGCDACSTDVSCHRTALTRYYDLYDLLFNYAVIEGSFTFFLALKTAPDEILLRDAVDFHVFMVTLNQDHQQVL
jgi:hypothetical protein